MRTILTVVLLVLSGLCTLPVFGQQPSLVNTVDFNDLPSGVQTVIEFDRYRSEGILLFCDPGQYLYAVERGGPGNPFGRSLAVSGNSSVTIEFVIPGTNISGAVQRSEIQALDQFRLGYQYTYYDINGGGGGLSGNNRDYIMGGWVVFHQWTGRAHLCIYAD